MSNIVSEGFECPLSTGDMVRWYDLGADDVICRDTGYGIIVETRAYSYYGDSFKTYSVLCSDEMLHVFERRHLEFLILNL